MKRLYAFLPLFLLSIIASAFLSSCKDSLDVTNPFSAASSNSEKFMVIAEKSSSVNSFTPNYNEEQAMTLAGTLAKDIYPLRVGQKMKLIEKNLVLVKDSTTAVGTLVQKFEGTLIIQGTLQMPTIGLNSHVDTTLQKSFYTTITRKIKFDKIKNTGNDTLDWKVSAISLPVGGTTGTNIDISKLKLTTQDGTEIVIDDPNTYFFKVGKDNDSGNENEDNDNHGFESELGMQGNNNWKNLLTWYGKNKSVKLTAEVLSTSPDPDFLTVTYSAMMNGNSRTKNKFNLVSTVQEGNYYRKTYESNYLTNSKAVRMHAVINAYTRSSVYNMNAVVEARTWGIPYRVE